MYLFFEWENGEFDLDRTVQCDQIKWSKPITPDRLNQRALSHLVTSGLFALHGYSISFVTNPVNAMFPLFTGPETQKFFIHHSTIP